MLIYESENVRVLQHPYLQLFYIEIWDWCDNPRSYGQHYGWNCIKCTCSIDEVNDIVKGMKND